MSIDATEGSARGRNENGIGWVIFDNPARLNALSEAMSAQALALVQGYDHDDVIRAIALRGAGEKAFISGGDISKFDLSGKSTSHAERRRNFDALKAALRQTGKPVVAMIHGWCLGAGMGLALASDIRIASDAARLAIPAAKRGLGYPADHLRDLVQIAGHAVARDLMFTGRQIEADEALRLGLVTRVVPAEALERETDTLLATLAGNAPLSIRAAKLCIEELLKEGASQDKALMRALEEAASNSEDFREATRAFLEKRPPIFSGR